MFVCVNICMYMYIYTYTTFFIFMKHLKVSCGHCIASPKYFSMCLVEIVTFNTPKIPLSHVGGHLILGKMEC